MLDSPHCIRESSGSRALLDSEDAKAMAMCHGPWRFGVMVDAPIPNEEMITDCEYRVPAAPVNRRKTHNVIPVRSLFIRGRYFSSSHFRDREIP